MNKQTECNELIYANERITHTAEGSLNAPKEQTNDEQNNYRDEKSK